MSSSSLRDQITEDMKVARKSKNSLALLTLKLVFAECRNQEIALKKSLNNVQMIEILKKQVKFYRETIDQYKKVGRTSDSLEQEKRLHIVQSYLPKPLSDTQLDHLIEKAIQDLKPQSLKQMGQVMKTVQERAGGGADNRRLSELIRQRLQSL